MAAAASLAGTEHWTVDPEGKVFIHSSSSHTFLAIERLDQHHFHYSTPYPPQVHLKVTLDGIASLPPQTVYDMMKATAEVITKPLCSSYIFSPSPTSFLNLINPFTLAIAKKFAHRNALCVKRAGRWQTWTYQKASTVPAYHLLNIFSAFFLWNSFDLFPTFFPSHPLSSPPPLYILHSIFMMSSSPQSHSFVWAYSPATR